MGIKSGLNDFGLGRLITLSDNEEIDYQPFEVSKFGLGIIAREDLEPGAELLLQTVDADVKLCTINSVPHELFSGQSRYTLSALDGHTDMEELFQAAGCFRKIAEEATRSEFRSARFDVKPTITVHAKTFGAIGEYTLHTVNVSKSGLLVAAEIDSAVPFIVNTLLEITIDPTGQWLPHSIQCLAKVVRHKRVLQSSRRIQYFGIHFIEFNGQAQVMWQRALADLERKATEARLSQVKSSIGRPALAG